MRSTDNAPNALRLSWADEKKNNEEWWAYLAVKANEFVGVNRKRNDIDN